MRYIIFIFVVLALYVACKGPKQKDKDQPPITKIDTTIVDDHKALMPPGGYDTTNAEVQLRRKPRPPSTAIFLQGTATGPTSIKLTWTGGGSTNLVYRKFREYADTWVKIVETTNSTYTDTGAVLTLFPGQPFTYKIVSGSSTSNLVTVTTLTGSGTGNAVILLDFDGHTWNGRYHAPSGLSQEQIIYHVDSVRREAARVNPNLIITTDEAVYSVANPYKRIRQILTISWEWYGQAGGVSYTGSFSWGNDTPCWVFTSLLSFNSGWIIRASVHEGLGHPFGLGHVTVTSTVPCANWMSGNGHYGYNGCFDASQKTIINSKL